MDPCRMLRDKRPEASLWKTKEGFPQILAPGTSDTTLNSTADKTPMHGTLD